MIAPVTPTRSLTLALDAKPSLKDLHWPVDVNGRQIGRGILAPLFEPVGYGDPVVAGSAATATCLDEGRRWRVRLDAGHRWSDGTTLTAEDAVRSVHRIVERERSGAAGWLGVRPDVPPARIVDAETVDYHFAAPTPYATAVFSMPQFAPAPAGQAALGPFRLIGQSEDTVVLHRNALQGPHQGAPDELVFRIIPSPEDCLGQYEAGLVDVTTTTSFGPRELAVLADRGDLVTCDIPLFASLEFGHRAGRLGALPGLRNTLGRLLRRDALAAATGGGARPWWSPVAPWDRREAASDEAVTSGDLRALRAACGEGLTIDYADYAPNGDVVGSIARQIGELLEIPVTTAAHSFPDYLRLAMGRDHCLLYTLTAPDFSHPAALLMPWASTGAQARHAGFSDGQLDADLAAARACLEAGEAELAWVRAAQRWCDVMPRIPLLQVRGAFLRAPRVGGCDLAADGSIPLGKLVIAGD